MPKSDKTQQKPLKVDKQKFDKVLEMLLSDRSDSDQQRGTKASEHTKASNR